MNTKSSSQTGLPKGSSGSPSYVPLAQFTLHLIKSILRTGLYASDHPEAQKGFRDLYAEFKQLIGDRTELTYLVMMTGEAQAITIEGYDPTPLALDRVMGHNTADLFSPKFLEFFDRWSLLSFSLKARISAQEFHSFIVLLSQTPEANRGTREASERLMQAFLDQHILHISTVFSEEMVGKDRHLPWRLKLALSRLRRDLRMLPLYTRATPEEIKRVKLQIIDDVIRPLRTTGLLKDFLVNCDLVAADLRELDENQITQEILQSMPEEMLVATAQEFVKDLERQERSRDKRLAGGASEESTRSLKVLRKLAGRLCGTGSALAHESLESLLKHNILSLADMPPRSGRRSRRKDWPRTSWNGQTTSCKAFAGSNQAKKGTNWPVWCIESCRSFCAEGNIQRPSKSCRRSTKDGGCPDHPRFLKSWRSNCPRQ